MAHHFAPRLCSPRALRKTASMRLVFGTSTPCARNAYSREIVSQARFTSRRTATHAHALISSFVMSSIVVFFG